VKLLIITSRVPWPLEKGDKLRIYHQIRELSREHEIVLCALNDAPLHSKAKEELLKYCREVHVFQLSKLEIGMNLLRCLFSRIPMQVGYFWSARLQSQLNAFIHRAQPDCIYCQLIRTSEYVRHHTHIPKVLDYMDVFSKGVQRRIQKVSFLQRFIFRMEWKRLLRYEAEIFSVFDQCCIISEQDRNLLPVSEAERIAVIPNGVDTDYFHPQQQVRKYDILFNGNMNYPPNVESAKILVQEILPLVLRQRPETSVLISGANPSPAVRALASKHVTITGWVEDVRTSFAHSRMLVAPMQSSIGLQNKLLEAMAMQMPCITTTLSNNALKATPEKQILIADNPEAFAKQILLLLEYPENANKIAAAGHAFIKEKYTWASSVKQLSALFTKAINRTIQN
jgi:sugar transferase (PEP-CTERM/EpsH1 system associated)